QGGKADYQRELANTLYNRGLLEQTLGKAKEAKGSYERALRLQKDLPAVRQEESRTLVSLGGLLAASDPAAAEKALRRGRGLRGAVAKRGAPPAVRQELAQASAKLGMLLEDVRPDEAKKHFRRAVDLGEGLVGDFPTVPDYRMELAGVLNNLGVMLLGRGD